MGVPRGFLTDHAINLQDPLLILFVVVQKRHMDPHYADDKKSRPVPRLRMASQ
jgi:hypothetical protein